MHVLTGLIVVFFVYKYGDWRNWQKYHTTILFIAMGNLLYNFLTANYFLWRLDADFLSNHSLTEMIYTFIVFPGTVILFLGNYPQTLKRQILHVITWIAIYITWELVFVITNSIDYQYGWNLGWSALFDVVMFPILRVHQNNPLLAYVLSAIVCVSVLLYFDVPVHLPVEKR